MKFAAARTTKDIDLGLDQLPGIGDNWNQRAGRLLAILQERAALVMGDFFEFIIGEPTSELDAAPYGGGRFPVETVLTEIKARQIVNEILERTTGRKLYAPTAQGYSKIGCARSRGPFRITASKRNSR